MNLFSRFFCKKRKKHIESEFIPFFQFVCRAAEANWQFGTEISFFPALLCCCCAVPLAGWKNWNQIWSPICARVQYINNIPWEIITHIIYKAVVFFLCAVSNVEYYRHFPESQSHRLCRAHPSLPKHVHFPHDRSPTSHPCCCGLSSICVWIHPENQFINNSGINCSTTSVSGNSIWAENLLLTCQGGLGLLETFFFLLCCYFDYLLHPAWKVSPRYINPDALHVSNFCMCIFRKSSWSGEKLLHDLLKPCCVLCVWAKTHEGENWLPKVSSCLHMLIIRYGSHLSITIHWNFSVLLKLPILKLLLSPLEKLLHHHRRYSFIFPHHTFNK